MKRPSHPRGSGRRRATALVAGLLLAVLGASACRAPQERSIVLVSLDTTRVDLLGVYGGRGLTPRLDAFANESLRFERAFTTAPYTGPSHASMLTGQNPPRHGLRDYLEQALPEAAQTLAEILAARGYATGAFVSTYVLDPRFGLDQGFEVYDSPDRDAGEAHWRPGPDTTSRALSWLRARAPDQPFLLFVHWYDAHGPYMPPAAHREALPAGVAPGSPEARRQRYYEQARVLDEQFGRLLDAVAETGQDPIIAVVADHGELLGHHGRKLGAHSNALVDATLRVPLLLHLPGHPPGVRDEPVSVIDLLPTFLQALDLPIPDSVEGRSLLAPASEHTVPAYSETFYPFFGRSPDGQEFVSLRDDRFVLLVKPNAVQLFDIVNDPGEQVDVAERHADRRDALLAELARRRSHWGSSERRTLDLDPEEEADHRARLRALGYLEDGPRE